MSHGLLRREDTLIGKILRWWPAIVMIVGGIATAAIMKERIERSITLSEHTTDRVYAVEVKQAVQSQQLDDLKDDLHEIKRDIKQVLRNTR